MRITQPHLDVGLEGEEDVGEEPLVDVRPAELGDAEGRPRRPGAELGTLSVGAGLPIGTAACRRLLRVLLLVLAFI